MEPAQQNSKIIGEQLMNLNKISSKPDGGHCGYCQKYQSFSWGFTKQIMHPYTYQLLAERGWRRCGFYYYKPDIKQSCCKLWTHRMNVNKYKIKKDQKKTVKHVVQWLKQITQGQKQKNMMKQDVKKEKINKQVMNKGQNNNKIEKGKQQKLKQQKITLQIPQKWTKIMKQSVQHLTKIIQTHKKQFFALFSKNLISQDQQHDEFQYVVDENKLKCFISQANAASDFYCNYLMLLFGLNKIVFKKQYNCIEFVKDIGKYIQGHLNEKMKGIVLVQVERSGYLLFTQNGGEKMQKRNKIEQQLKRRNSVQKKQSKQINESKHRKQSKPSTKMENQVKHPKKQEQKPQKQQNPYFPLIIQSDKITFGPLTVTIVPAQVTKDSWKMYQKYCTQIHQKAQKSQSSYSGFLCQKALKFIQQTTDKPCQKQYMPAWESQNLNKHPSQKIKGKRTKLMGCYHMKYYIDKQFIGVGVVDFFPDGMSSVYFFYQPKYKDQRLGVFSSLIQIEYVRWLYLSFPQYKNYYMGFYIQNCIKMNYKGNYQPFDLLCPITYQFVECTSQMRQLIDKIQKRQIQSVQLAKNNNKIDDMNFQTDIGVYINQKVKIKYQGKMLSLRDLNPRIMITVLGMLRDMAQVWGKHLFQAFTFTF